MNLYLLDLIKGNYDGCKGLRHDLVHYCVAQTDVPVGKAGNALISIYMGLCMPLACDEDMLYEILVRGINETICITPPIYSELNYLFFDELQ